MAAPRLNRELLTALVNSEIKLPGYDADRCKAGIVHLGLGAFARAHLATYTEAILDQQGGDWRILGVSLRHAEVAEQLVPQDGLYTCVEQSGEGATLTEKTRVLSVVENVLVAPDDPAAVLNALQRSDVRIVSLTVTEKGYCHDPASGELQLEHPDIVWDLAHFDSPRTAIGFLVAGLAYRFANKQPAYTVLSLDNLPNNGKLLKRLAIAFASQIDPQLANRIATVEFPSTMVDRIVPATTNQDRSALAKRLGYSDNGMVKTEPFSQWVIEDRFSAGRPDWGLAGALFVDDVAPYESLKLRLLNGSHSAIAYLGVLAGHEFVHEVMADAQLAKYVSELMADELAPTIRAPSDISLAEYQLQLLDRFNNPSLAHRTLQIAMDGSQKLPQRILAPLRDRIASQQPYERLVLVIAAWLRFVEETLASEGVRALKDPLAVELDAVRLAHSDNLEARVGEYLRLSAVFGSDLVHNEEFVQRLCFWLRELEKAH